MFSLEKYGDGVCLARLAALLCALSLDRERLRRISVGVTGSNGKGSTAAFCASIGCASGLRTGLFTSPHLYRFNERFQIDGVQIDDVQLARLISRVETAIAELTSHGSTRFGAFEAQFALACLYFQETNCDFAVFEAGIGGRYDPVRLLGTGLTCVTSVDYEHVELLGNSLELICSDKSDACAAGGTIIYGENCRSLRSHIVEYNRNRDVTSLFVRDEIGIGRESNCARAQGFDFQFGDDLFRSLEIGLSGAFQLNNAAIAVALFVLWRKHARPERASSPIEAAVRTGLADTRWPGRLELVRDNPFTVIDVGHTPDGIMQALAGLATAHGAGGWILVTGVSRDKKAAEIVTLLAPSFDVIVCTAAHHKGLDPNDIATAARSANSSATVHVAATIEDAVALSTRLATETGRKIFVAGGLFLAIEYASVAKGTPAQDLNFF